LAPTGYTSRAIRESRTRTIHAIIAVLSILLVGASSIAAAGSQVVVKDLVYPNFSSLDRIVVTPHTIYVRAALEPYNIEDLMLLDEWIMTNAEVYGALLIDIDMNPETGVKAAIAYPSDYAANLYWHSIPGIDVIVDFYYSAWLGETYGSVAVWIYNGAGQRIAFRFLPDSNELFESDGHSYVVLHIPWDTIEELYYNNTGITPSPPYRVALGVLGETGDPLEVYLVPSSLIQYSDTLPPGDPVLLPGHSPTIDGSIMDWPAASLLSSEPPPAIDPMPSWLDVNAVLMAADEDNLYIAYNLSGQAPLTRIVDPYNEEQVLATLSFTTTIEITESTSTTRVDIRVYLTNTLESRIFLYNHENRNSVLLPAPTPPDGGALEIAIPLEHFREIGVDIGPGSNVTHLESWTSITLNDRLNNPSLTGVNAHIFIVDPDAGTVRPVGYYAGITKYYRIFTGTYEINLSYSNPGLGVNATLYSPSASGPVEVTLGVSSAFIAPVEPPSDKPYAFVYFRVDLIDDTSQVTWPFTLEISLPEDTRIDKLYYYNKHVNGFVELPRELYTLNGSRITIQYTQDLYEQGDPGILVYTIPSRLDVVAGEVVGHARGGIPAVLVLAASMAVLLYLVMARSKR